MNKVENVMENQSERALMRECRRASARSGFILFLYMLVIVTLKLVFKLILPGALPEVVAPVISFTAVFMVIYRKDFVSSFKGRMGNEKQRSRKVFAGTAKYITGAVLGLFATALVLHLFELLGLNMLADIKTVPKLNGVGGICYVTYLFFLEPAFQVLVFFGFLQGRMSKYDEKAAMYISAVMYAVVRGMYILIPATFVMGMVLAKATIKSKSIWTTVKINMLGSAMIYLGMYIVSGNSRVIQVVFAIILLPFLINGFTDTVVSFRRFLSKEEPVWNKNCIKIYFTSGAVLLLVAVSIAEDLVFMFI